MLRLIIIAALSMMVPTMADAQDDDDTTTEDPDGSMEQSFGGDPSDVRAHTGNDAATMTESVGAQAYTSRNDVYLGGNNNESDTPTGRNRLMAHELAHTLQQQNSTTNPDATEGGDDAESEDDAGARIPSRLNHRDRSASEDEEDRVDRRNARRVRPD